MIGQDYAAYTDEDFDVWSTLFRRQMARLENRVCSDFLEGVTAVGLEEDAIPEFGAFGDRLERLSGWRVQAVDSSLTGRQYFELLASRRFPSSTLMRSRDELEHSKEPDMFHDVFGHIPILVNPRYADFLHRISRLALRWVDDDERRGSIGRAYKWTIEYGLVDRGDGLRVYGAGLISSSKELDYVFTDAPAKLPFSAAGVLTTTHVRAALQERYFVIRSFDELLESLDEIEDILDRRREAAPVV